MSTPLRLLILDDNAAEADIVFDELRRAGFSPFAERVDTEAAFAEKLDLSLNIILSEFSLRGYDALRALQLLQARGYDIPLIVVTDRVTQQVAVECYQRGAADCVFKDRLIRLGPAVTRALEQKRLRDHKRWTEQALRNSESRFRALIENSADGIIVLNADATIVYASPGVERSTGFSSDEIIGRNAFEFLDVREIDSLKAELATFIQQPQARDTATVALQHKSGSQLWLECTATNLVGEPSVQGVVVNFRDVTAYKRTEQERKRMTRQLSTLYECALQISQQTELSTLLPIIVRRAADLLGAPMGALYLMKQDKQSLELVVSHNLPPGLVGTQLALGEGLSGRVAATKQLLMVEDYAHWEGRAAVYKDFPFRRVLGVPMMIKDRVIGVLNVTDDGATGAFDDEEMRLAALFADQAAIAIENVRLLDETRARANEFEALYQTTNDLAANQELPALLQTIVERATQLLEAPSGRILLYDAGRRDLVVAAAVQSSTPIGTRMRMGEGVAGRAALSQQPLIVNDYDNWQGRVPYHAEASLYAVVGIPMLYRGELIGVLTVTENRQPERRFTPGDARLMALFATQAASAVNNARLFQQTCERAEQLALLYDAGLTLNRMLDPQAVMQFLLKIAAKSVHADRVEFFRYDPGRQALFYESGSSYMDAANLDPLHQIHVALGEDRGLVGRVAADRIPLYLPDVRCDPRWIGFDPAIRSAFLTPVEREDKLRGVVTVCSVYEDAFSPSDQRLVALFANQLSVAMENARLFKETNRRAEHLGVVNRIASAANRTTTLKDLLESIYQEIRSVMPSDAFFIGLYESATDEIDFQIMVDQGIRVPPQRISRNTASFTSHVISTMQPLLIRDHERERERLPTPRLFGTMQLARSFLGVPMKIGETMVGVVAVQSYQPDVYGEEDEQLLMTIADQIAVGIEKARLFEALLARRE